MKLSIVSYSCVFYNVHTAYKKHFAVEKKNMQQKLAADIIYDIQQGISFIQEVLVRNSRIRCENDNLS